jgi:hypothetical protein
MKAPAEGIPTEEKLSNSPTGEYSFSGAKDKIMEKIQVKSKVIKKNVTYH